MSMESFSNFENAPITKEHVVDELKSKGLQDSEVIELLEKFTAEREAFFEQEGRKDARLESWREKAHALNLANCFAEAIRVMQDVVDSAHGEGDTESYEEALWIIDKLKVKLGAHNSESVIRTVEKDDIVLEESGEKVSREDVLDAFKRIQGKTDPARLDDTDPEVAEANQLFDRWSTQQQAEGEDDRLRNKFEQTMLFVDAGFHDPEYLKDVLEWISQDAGNTTKDTNNPTMVQLRNDMANAIRKIRQLLDSNQ